MRKFLTIVLLSFIINPLFAQDSTVKYNTIKDAKKLATINYAYPDYMSGRVYLRNTNVVGVKLNYHLAKDEMFFVDEKKNKMILGNLETIEKITIGNDTYYPLSNGYVKNAEDVSNFKLLIKPSVRLAGKEQKGGYGGYSATSSPGSYNPQDDPNLKTTEDANLIFSFSDTYYVSRPGKQAVKANKKELLSLFSDYKDQLKEYLASNAVNFSKREDLVKMLQYLQSLSK